jgi:hypothetical protein
MAGLHRESSHYGSLDLVCVDDCCVCNMCFAFIWNGGLIDKAASFGGMGCVDRVFMRC